MQKYNGKDRTEEALFGKVYKRPKITIFDT